MAGDKSHVVAGCRPGHEYSHSHLQKTRPSMAAQFHQRRYRRYVTLGL
ncbi:hypothetical protein EPIB2_784 [Tritonibacter mobilis]|nr:hypothetical protein EPIB2_784 [Tritonibacter mobilis]